ncbi:MAG: Uncharacterised protein [Cellulomonadaceae bacterium TMED98]|nr:MAG: Uncharacterised protein [Cellulomonadaceae bacterium TMED98]
MAQTREDAPDKPGGGFAQKPGAVVWIHFFHHVAEGGIAHAAQQLLLLVTIELFEDFEGFVSGEHAPDQGGLDRVQPGELFGDLVGCFGV